MRLDDKDTHTYDREATYWYVCDTCHIDAVADGTTNTVEWSKDGETFTSHF
ncbi:MAG: hypothetical protein IJY50_03615 [Clostridia bacterium]|nr:hypothetical protein [Clostridia bacterium]